MNTTSSQTLIDPFTTPTGSLFNRPSRWTWNIATESLREAGKNFSVRQALWLDINPFLNLRAPELGYLGGGIIAYGLKYSGIQRFQGDDGTCISFFDSKCIDAFLNDTAGFAPDIAGSSAVPMREICDELITQQDWDTHGLPLGCFKLFDRHA